ncbi:nitroreductase family protein [Haloechinothrix halophila]|uniref:nitroreductase family protein n=1 Tax=Haloechinothrix halophila TaxID=1069073 RepID=UPI0003FB0959|nr:nitroreductase family protein [Haloechinothrix halophila]
MQRKPAATSVAVHELIAQRWSPRAFDPDAKVSEEQLRALLEAARWAPSFGNTQPARFLVGRRGDAVFDRILGTLTERNQDWASRVGVLLAGVAITRNEKGDVPYAEYGVALAAQNLVLQAVAEGLAAHQMAGFDSDALHRAFELPDDVRPVVTIAVGVQTDADVLGAQRLVERERGERSRIPLAEFARAGWDTPAF